MSIEDRVPFVCDNCGGQFVASPNPPPKFCPYCRAPDPKEPDQADGDLLLVTLQRCEHCQTEGRIIRQVSGGWDEPREVDLGECPVCEGTGGELVPTDPVTEAEIMEP